MPSLRRTLSSPAVRSSPYPTNANIGPGGRNHGNRPRRSSGSETSGRRVLADIEWWRVVDGQRDADTEQESEERERDQGQEPQIPDLMAGSGISLGDVGAEHPSAPLPWTSVPDSPESSFAVQFAALAITPRTPTRRHTLESSWSSLESTPEAAEAPIEGTPLVLTDLDMGFEDVGSLPALPNVTRVPSRPIIPIRFRSHSCAELSVPHEDEPTCAADLDSLSPTLFH